jgi:hypothetical protein
MPENETHIIVDRDAGTAEISHENRSHITTTLVNLNTGMSVLLPIKRKTDDERQQDIADGRFTSF